MNAGYARLYIFPFFAVWDSGETSVTLAELSDSPILWV